MTTNEIEVFARIAYEAYGETTNFKNFRGDPMPEFDDLGKKIQQAWLNSTLAIIMAKNEYDKGRRIFS